MSQQTKEKARKTKFYQRAITHLRIGHTKFQFNISKDCREKSGNPQGNFACQNRSNMTKLELDLY